MDFKLLKEKLWNFNVTTTQRTFLLLCGVALLSVYCGSQLFTLQDLETHIEEIMLDSEVEDVDGSLNIERFPANETNYPLFQPNVAAEFPTVRNGSLRIPHVIHQICDSENVPELFTESMRSFVSHNPTWEYRFWTYDSGRLFLKKHYNYLVDVYDRFETKDVKKSDLLRIAVLFEFGGIYVDLDVKNLRPLNMTTTKYACILPTEPFEHSAILYGEEVIFSNAVLLCRPKHPFYKQLLLNLQHADPEGHPTGTTGPLYVTKIFLKYNNITKSDLTNTENMSRSNSPYFYKGERDEESDEGIYIPNTQYFMDKVDSMWMNEDGELKQCVDKDLDSLSFLQKRGCTEYESRKIVRKNRLYTFTIHYWYHLWLRPESITRRLHIKRIIPNVILYNE